MDWHAAIEWNREALKRVLASLVAMASLADGDVAPTLPRHLHQALLRLLRPAEAATRRLIIVMARGIVVTPPPPRGACPRAHRRRDLGPWFPSPASQGRNHDGTVNATWILPRKTGEGDHAKRGGGGVVEPCSPTPRKLSLPLFDPLRQPFRHQRPTPNSVPRISLPGLTQPFPIALRKPPSAYDPISAARLAMRLAALASALDDLPKQARRFARWRARVAAATQNGDRQASLLRPAIRRLWPLKPGRPPGWCRRPVHEVHEILNVVHGLAFWALEPADTS